MNFREDAVGCEAMIGKHDAIPERLVENRPAVPGRIVIGKR